MEGMVNRYMYDTLRVVTTEIVHCKGVGGLYKLKYYLVLLIRELYIHKWG